MSEEPQAQRKRTGAARPLDDLPPELRRLARRAEQPESTRPMLPEAIDEAFSDPGWVFERLLEGERILAFRDGADVRLMTRARQNVSHFYPELVEALADQEAEDFVLDGMVVAFEGSLASASGLQRRKRLASAEAIRRSGVAVHYYVFDLLHLDGHDLARLPLRTRKRLLRRALALQEPLRYTPHRVGAGEAFFAEARRHGWKGVVAKEADAPYLHRRSPRWLKVPCVATQALVVGGFVHPPGNPGAVEAVLVGYYPRRGGERRLRLAGAAAVTRCDRETLRELRAALEPLEREASPFAPDPELPRRDVRWVEPRLVAEVGFSGWTHGGYVRDPRFVTLRRDRRARRVTREAPAG